MASGIINGAVTDKYGNASSGASMKVEWVGTADVNGNLSNCAAQIFVKSTGATISNISIRATIMGTLIVANRTVAANDTWVSFGIVSFPISHDSSGHGSFSLSASFIRSTETSGTYYIDKGNIATTTCYLDDIPRVSQVTMSKVDFNIGENITIYTNRKSTAFVHQIHVEFGSYSVWIASNVTDSWVWDTDATQDLYNQIPTMNAGNGIILLDTLYNGVSIGTSQVGFIARVVSSNPTFAAFAYQDVDSVAPTLTGNDQYIVSSYSDLLFSISVANKAVARNGATMSRYLLMCGSKQLSVNYSAIAEVSGQINDVTAAAVSVTAIDSRGNQTTVTLVATFIPYVPPAIYTFEVLRANGVDAAVTLAMTGKIAAVDFGAVTNAVTRLYYAYKSTASPDWIVGSTVLTPTVDSSGNVTLEATLIIGDLGSNGFTVGASFNILVALQDSILLVPAFREINAGIPGWCLKKFGSEYGFGVGAIPSDVGLYVGSDKINPAFDEEDDFHDTVGLYAYTQVPTATYTKKYAHYWRKGDLIYFTIALSGNISVAGVNGACVSGLPFNVDVNHIRDFSMSISILTGGIAASSTGLSCVPWGSNVLIVRARVGDYPVWTTGNYDFVISGWYKKA